MTTAKVSTVWWRRGGVLGLVLVVFAIYVPAWNGGFVWDDDAWTTNIAHLTRDLRGLGQMWARPTALQQYFPLTGTTFWLDHQLWGAWTLPYHLENVALHALGVLLFCRLLGRLAVPGAWLAAALLALHPMMVESVAWIAERKNVLSLVLFLGALLAYGRAMDFWAGGGGGARIAWSRGKRGAYAAALLLFMAALLAKVSTFALPPVILLLAWWKRGRLTWRADVLPLLPFFLLAFAMGAGSLWLEQHHVGAEGVPFQKTVAERCVRAGRAWWFYLGKLLWPAPLPPIHRSWSMDPSPWLAWLWPCSALLAVGLAWWARARVGRGLPAVLLIYSGVLLPVLGFANMYGMLYAPVADRWVHLPALAVFALAAAAAARLAGRFQRPWLLPALAFLILPVLAWRTWLQAGIYRDNETLMRTALNMNPGCWVALYNLGNIRNEQGRVDEAILLFQQALSLNPQHVKAHNNLGNALAEKGRLEEALAELRQAVALMPELPVAHFNLGNCLMRLGLAREAAECFQTAVALDPDLASAHSNLAGLFFQQGRLAEARAHFEKVVALRPDSADALANLGVVLSHSGMPAEGRAAYETALLRQPDHVVALYNLAWLLATCPADDIRDASGALEHARKAVELAGNDGLNPEALRSLAAALAESRQHAEAGLIASRAARLAEQSGNADLAARLRQDVALYRAGFSQRDPGLAPAPK